MTVKSRHTAHCAKAREMRQDTPCQYYRFRTGCFCPQHVSLRVQVYFARRWCAAVSTRYQDSTVHSTNKVVELAGTTAQQGGDSAIENTATLVPQYHSTTTRTPPKTKSPATSTLCGSCAHPTPPHPFFLSSTRPPVHLLGHGCRPGSTHTPLHLVPADARQPAPSPTPSSAGRWGLGWPFDVVFFFSAPAWVRLLAWR